eukprot:TRINITY_DN45870_c0_g1_i1.p1 TRINITY_DN45870_c0_g1~~TRINITY_DN45870_c0_g1_i1.p1  ORF type:complete len:194 (-),score=33.77 TRINITY_DN45870_c0_g1_i1:361-942(-)
MHLMTATPAKLCLSDFVANDEASWLEPTSGEVSPRYGKACATNPVLSQVATAEDDIYEAIVHDALSFADSRIQAASKVLQWPCEETVNSESEEEHVFDSIRVLQGKVFRLRMVLANRIEGGAKMPECAEAMERKLGKATRRKITKKLTQAEVVLESISRATWMRSGCGGLPMKVNLASVASCSTSSSTSSLDL